MKYFNKILIIIVCVAVCLTTFAQVRTVTFTGRDWTSHYHIPLHHVTVFNLDQLWEEVLYYPDTNLVLGTVGIDDHDTKGVQLMQNVPNPFDGTTEFALTLSEDNDVYLEIYDINGNLAVGQHFSALQTGTHLFKAILSSPQTYLLSAKVDNGQMTIKMVNEGHGAENSIRYLGMTNSNGDFTLYLKNDKSSSNFPFSVGDEMKYTGYAVIDGDMKESNTISCHQTNSETFTLQFDVTAPTITTAAVNNLTSNSASCGGNVTASGGSPVTSRGVCWSTSHNPVITNNHTTSGSGAGSFTSTLTGLSSGTTYYVRAYATNGIGTSYGSENSFTTLSLPIVTTNAVSNITGTAATCGGNVTSDGGGTVTERGVCWSTSQNPTVSGNYTSSGNGVGSFTSNITGLSGGTTYYVRAYATNGAGTAYGEQRSFTTIASLPSVVTTDVSNMTSTSATCGGSVTASGGTTVTSRGVCWSTSENPNISNNHIANGSGVGSFTITMTELIPGKTYYYRAYATNVAGTAYGEQRSFFAHNPCLDSPTVMDYDGNVYNTVQIGEQCWMAENLRTTHYSNGVSLTFGNNGSYQTPYYYYPNDNPINVNTYGYLYNWKALMGSSASSNATPSGVQGICPNGWHVPSYSEWLQLKNFVQGQSEFCCGLTNTYIAKSLASTSGWLTSQGQCAIGNDQSTNNITGFNVMPAGHTYGNPGSTSSLGYFAEFLCSSQNNDNNSYYISLSYGTPEMKVYSGGLKYRGGAVRCVKGGNYLPSVNTTNVSYVAESTVVCGGNVTVSGSAPVINRGVCWGTSSNPTIDDNQITDGTGTGNFTSQITGLSEGTVYYFRAYATNSVGIAYGNQVVFSWPNPNNGQPCQNAATVTDYDGNNYSTVQIGSQCWMAENLRTTHYANGISIALGSDTSSSVAYRYYPGNNSSYVTSYGYLYNWKAVVRTSNSSNSNPSGVQGVCPNGWHVPSYSEWMQMILYVQGQSSYRCEGMNTTIARSLASNTGWITSDAPCGIGNDLASQNSTGFSAMPAGWSDGINNSSVGYHTEFWCSYQYNNNKAYDFQLGNGGSEVEIHTTEKRYGVAVRCVKN